MPGLLALFFLLLPLTSEAARVVCIDDTPRPGDNAAEVARFLGYIYNYEGYERARAAADQQANPNLMVTFRYSSATSFQDCLALLANGDELVIIAHGVSIDVELLGTDYGFWWGGQRYRNFGAGVEAIAVPAGLQNLRNVTFTFGACFSAAQPTVPGVPVIDRLLQAMGGAAAGNSGMGFTGIAQAQVVFGVRGGTAAQQDAAIRCLTLDQTWQANPPANRPGAQMNQLTAAQAIVDGACPGAGPAGTVTVVIPNQIADPNAEEFADQLGYPEPQGNIQQCPAPQPNKAASTASAVQDCTTTFCGFPEAVGIRLFVPCEAGALSISDFDADGEPSGEFVELTNLTQDLLALDACTFAAFDAFTEDVITVVDLDGRSVAAGAMLTLSATDLGAGDDDLPDGPGAVAVFERDDIAVGTDVTALLDAVVAAIVYFDEDTFVGQVPASGGSKGDTDLRSAVASAREAPLPVAFALGQNYPNPFNPSTTIPYRLSEATHVQVAVYDALGRRVRVLVDAFQDAGAHDVRWDGRDGSGRVAAAGVYFYHLDVGDFQSQQMMVLTK